MFRATLTSLLSRKVRLVLAALAVVLGVMFVSGSFVLTETLRGSFDSMFTNAYSSTDVGVSPKASGVAEESGAITPSIPTSVADNLRTVPGVAGVTGRVFVDGARLIGSDGKVVSTMGAPRFGANWEGENSFVQLREGRGPKADNEIAINAGLAKAANVKVGDQVGVLTTQPKRMFTLVGIFGYAGGKDTMSSAHEVDFTMATAQELMVGKRGVYTSLRLDAAQGTTHAQLRDRVKTALGNGYVVQTGEELEKSAKDEYSSGLGFFNKILLGFAAIALFVGTFLIINTFSIIIAQRTRELALLRAIGANRRQIIGSVLTEATVIGVVASVLGLLSGIGVGALLGWLFGKLTGLTTTGIHIPLSAYISAFAVGVPITLIAAVTPAIRAARIPPVAALQQAAAVDRPLTKLTIVGGLVTTTGAAMLGFGLRGSGPGLVMIAGGSLILFLGVALLTPMLARPVADLIGRIMSWSVPGKLGRLNSRRNPRRTAITAAALMVGVALITGMSVIVSSVNSTLDKAAQNDIKADLLIGAYNEGNGPTPTLDRSVLDRAAGINGVQRVLGEYDDIAEVTPRGKEATGSFFTAYTDDRALVDMWALKTVSGSLDRLTPNQAFVSKDISKQLKVSPGDTVTVQFGKGDPQQITVVGVYESTLIGGWVVHADMVRNFAIDRMTWSYVELKDGVPVSQVKKQVAALVADNPEMDVNTIDDLVDQASAEFEQVLTMVQIMLGLAILIAVLGIVNTLALSIIERTRELGMLRAIGLRRAQLMRMITVESVIISVFGALLGMAVGTGLGTAIVRALKSEGITEFSLPWDDLALYLGVAAVVGVVAAVIPAIRAARINVLTAIASE